ncbi:hypothetical protein [Puniceicoccus vermicola]|uniref:Uncharacterized protein n=1 Tax=Puniceicoccus vermicola TaxID=388746 RepID=A0A7X1AXG2_9BACT|nr:hypothetical protein [Puniceicoccus vermicola]MBC2601771.1 hypothetical protein [Puniceicoccus vermicola]
MKAQTLPNGVSVILDDTEAELRAIRAGVRDQLKDRAQRIGKTSHAVFPKGLRAEAFSRFGKTDDQGWAYMEGPLPIVLEMISAMGVAHGPWVGFSDNRNEEKN